MKNIEKITDEYLSPFFDAIKSLFDKCAIPDDSYLYHYTSLDGLWGILEGKSIWCSSVIFQNDQSELQHGLSVAESLLDEYIEKAIHDNQKSYLLAFKQDLKGFILKSRIFTFSLSKE
ncbi:unnamed protein product [marine sediment metagenome]|uniref:Uncharacterized protein n=1 Tax=marine sediment metagenome TaxID=412755 RepID=X1CYJ6_9ZZZZ